MRRRTATQIALRAPYKPVQRLSGKERLSRRGKKSRTKGHSFERLVAQLFRRWFPSAHRGLQYQDGKNCCDVEGTPYWIECKRHKRITIEGASKLFMAIKSDGRPVLLVYKGDRRGIIVQIAPYYGMSWELFEPTMGYFQRAASSQTPKTDISEE